MTIDVVRKWGIASLGSRFVRIGERLRAHSQDLMEAHSVTIPVHHYPLLTAVRENNGLSVSDLATSLGVSQPGVTRSVNQLTDQGLVQVAAGQTDKRVRLVTITDAGRQVLTYAETHFWPLIERELRTVLGDEADQLLRLLNRLEDQIEERKFFVNAERNHHG